MDRDMGKRKWKITGLGDTVNMGKVIMSSRILRMTPWSPGSTVGRLKKVGGKEKVQFPLGTWWIYMSKQSFQRRAQIQRIWIIRVFILIIKRVMELLRRRKQTEKRKGPTSISRGINLSVAPSTGILYFHNFIRSRGKVHDLWEVAIPLSWLLFSHCRDKILDGRN